jgi:hypothetical protein
MHGCMPGRISVQNTARCTVPRPLFLHSMHARQSARTIIVRRNAGRLLFHPCRACTDGLRFQRRNQPASGPSLSPSCAGVAAARTCGSMPGLSTARDSCNARPQWSSPRQRWTAATRARDGRPHPEPSMVAAWVRDRRPRPGTARAMSR